MIIFDDVMDRDKVVFHMEAQNYSLMTYTTNDNPKVIEVQDVSVDDVHFFNKQAMRAYKDADKGFIVLTDNIFKKIPDKKMTITMWIFASELRDESILFPYSGTVYDAQYKNYMYANCRPVHEIRVENNLTIYHTTHYTSGSYYMGKVPNNKWCFITVCIDGNVNSENKIRLYIDGQLISPGYTTDDSNPLGFDMDWYDITKVGMQNRWEFLGGNIANLYYLQEFTVYNDCLVYDEAFEVPTVPSNSKLQLPLSTRVYLGNMQTGSEDHISNDAGQQYLGAYSDTSKSSVTMKNQSRSITSIAFIGDAWTLPTPNYWVDIVKNSLNNVSCTFKAVSNATSAQIKSQFDSVIDSVDMIVCNIGEGNYISNLDAIEAVEVVQYMVSNVVNKSKVLFIASYTQMGTRVSENVKNEMKYLKHLHHLLNDYFYGPDSPRSYPLLYYMDMYVVTNLIYDFQPQHYLEDGIHLSLSGHQEYANTVLPKLRDLISYYNTYQYPKQTYWDINCKLLIAKYDLIKDINPCTIEVNNTPWFFELTIPWPYEQFKEDEQFFLVAPNGQFVPEYDYIRQGDKIRLQNDPYNAGYAQEWKFVFLHKHLFYSVRKFEQSIETVQNKRTYTFDSPYDRVVDLKEKVRVYYDRNFLNPQSNLYEWNNERSEITFSSSLDFSGQHLISFLCFYTGTNNEDTTAMLPMSGFVEFSKNKIDRVYDKDLFAVFLNGKLVSKQNILDYSSRIHKLINVNSRYDLQVMNMSPQISYLTPFFQMPHKKNLNKTCIWEFFSKLRVPYPKVYHPRYYVYPDWLTPVEWKPVINNTNFYLNLLHHGVQESEKHKDLHYTIRFFRDPWESEPEPVKVLAQVRLKGNTEQFYSDHTYQTLIGTLPTSLTQDTSKTARLDAPGFPNGLNRAMYYDDNKSYPKWNCLFSIQVQNILNADRTYSQAKYGYSIDGIMARLEINNQQIDHYNRLYYELDADNYERDAEIEILEWTISSGPNNTGNVWYRKMLRFFPFYTPSFPEED